MDFLITIRSISSTRSSGPGRTFTELQLIRAIQILGEKKILGRTMLSRILNIGSGAIRTIINILEENNIIVVKKSGCCLTEKGINIYEQIKKRIPLLCLIDAGRLSVAKFDAAVIVKESSKLINRGIEQRDAAIRVGAKGASTVIWVNHKFIVPKGSNDCERDFPNGIWKTLKDKFHPEDGDVIIISSAENPGTAIYGTLSSALTLFE
jgi:predicted transcriptional regulator